MKKCTFQKSKYGLCIISERNFFEDLMAVYCKRIKRRKLKDTLSANQSCHGILIATVGQIHQRVMSGTKAHGPDGIQ